MIERIRCLSLLQHMQNGAARRGAVRLPVPHPPGFARNFSGQHACGLRNGPKPLKPLSSSRLGAHFFARSTVRLAKLADAAYSRSPTYARLNQGHWAVASISGYQPYLYLLFCALSISAVERRRTDQRAVHGGMQSEGAPMMFE